MSEPKFTDPFWRSQQRVYKKATSFNYGTSNPLEGDGSTALAKKGGSSKKKSWDIKFYTDSFPRPPKTNHVPLKIDGWKMKFPFEMVPFQGTNSIIFRRNEEMEAAWGLSLGEFFSLSTSRSSPC